ncbi:glycosyltransferase [Acidocella sp.]|uniref:glycosyltransferase n=1 Tax=Acidocella sp. TaxID=50710 RepID=UPI003CFECA41
MLFTYWTHPAILEPPSAKAWTDLYPDFRVFSDQDVLKIIETEEERRLYNSIRLPAAKSDLARLLLLRQYGGLYVDAHTGPAKAERLAATLEYLSAYEVLLFGKKWQVKLPTDFNLMNTVIGSRKSSALLGVIINKIYFNLYRQRAQEYERKSYVSYGLHSLTGTGVFVQAFFDTSSPPPRLKSEHRDQIGIVMLENNSSHGFNIYQYYGYREPGQHWSERQKSERLFMAPGDLSSTSSLVSAS